MRILRGTDHAAMAWRNGGGTTYEVAREPAGGEADWRVSLADIRGPGPFSVFPGIDRVVTLVDGELLDLVAQGPGRRSERRLSLYRPFAFRGEDEVECRPSMPARVLNLMTRRDVLAGSVDCLRVDGTATLAAVGRDGVLLVAVVDGALSTMGSDGEVVTLERNDVVGTDAGETPVALVGEGVVAVVRITPTGVGRGRV